MQTATRSKVAFYWEGDDGSTRTMTYAELYSMTNCLAKGLQKLDVRKGDRVAIYMPAIPEQIAAVLSVARPGAIHTPVFWGFLAAALPGRPNNFQKKVVFFATLAFLGGEFFYLIEIASGAVVE